MQEFSFRIEKDLSPICNDTIPANFSECKSILTEIMAPYKRLVVTEESIPQAKSDLAKIRKVKSNIENMRKTVKKAYMQPVTIFESNCKDLTDILDEAAGNIDGQVKAFLNADVERKVMLLTEYFNANVGEMEKYICFDDIYNKRWENKTYSLDKAKNDIDGAIHQCIADLETIRSIGGPFTIALLEMYKDFHDLHACIQRNQEMIREKELAERMRANKKIDETQRAEKKKLDIDERESPTIFAVDFRAWVTEDQLNMLKIFLKTNSIKYGKVPKGE